MTAVDQGLLDRTVIYDTREEWLSSRAQFIGASEVAGILGVSEYKGNTPFGVGIKKLSPPATDDAPDQPWMEWGHRLEPVILARYFETRPGLLAQERPPYAVTVHPVLPLIRGTPDALCVDRDTGELSHGVDAKALGTYRTGEFGDEGSDEVPTDYAVQGLIYCEIFDVPRWDFAVLFGNHDYREYTVGRDSVVAERMATQVLDWWGRYIERREPLPLDGSDAAERYVRDAWPTHTEVLVEMTHDALKWGQIAAQARARIKEQTALKNEADNNLRALCAGAAGIEGICTNRASKPREVTDWKAAFAALSRRVDAGVAASVRSQHTETKPGSRSLRITIKEKQA